jgi:DNA-binding transcriptional regulator YdaS (Cro superfamily)
MADAAPLTPRDFDAWDLATPLQLLHLLKRLGVESTVIATWVGVKPAAVSQWNRGRREIPERYTPRLRRWAKDAVEKAWELNKKAVAAQPTEALRRAVQGEFAALWDRWTLEVLHNAGTLRKVILQQHGALGQWLSKDPLTAEDRESIALVMETILAQVDRLLTLEPEVPSAEDQLVARLTAARTDAQTTKPPAAEAC